MSKVFPALLKRLTICLKRLEKFGFPMIFLKIHTKSPLNSGLQIPCCFSDWQYIFNQFMVPTITFGKCFAEFMIPIALLKKFGS